VHSTTFSVEWFRVSIRVSRLPPQFIFLDFGNVPSPIIPSQPPTFIFWNLGTIIAHQHSITTNVCAKMTPIFSIYSEFVYVYVCMCILYHLCISVTMYLTIMNYKLSIAALYQFHYLNTDIHSDIIPGYQCQSVPFPGPILQRKWSDSSSAALSP